MKVARTLLLVAALFALNSSEPSAALATPVLQEAGGLLSSIQASMLDFEVPRVGAGRPAAAPISNTLALLGMGLLMLLGARILRRR